MVRERGPGSTFVRLRSVWPWANERPVVGESLESMAKELRGAVRVMWYLAADSRSCECVITPWSICGEATKMCPLASAVRVRPAGPCLGGKLAAYLTKDAGSSDWADFARQADLHISFKGCVQHHPRKAADKAVSPKWPLPSKPGRHVFQPKRAAHYRRSRLKCAHSILCGIASPACSAFTPSKQSSAHE
jgi:hypothetical protein